jgi:hypothetical protein
LGGTLLSFVILNPTAIRPWRLVEVDIPSLRVISQLIWEYDDVDFVPVDPPTFKLAIEFWIGVAGATILFHPLWNIRRGCRASLQGIETCCSAGSAGRNPRAGKETGR